MGERRGSVSLMFEIINSLLFIALFAWVAVSYPLNHANGEGYFSKFHAIDIATSAELVTAPQGDVVLRYDNFNPGLNLGFWFKKGSVAVGKPSNTPTKQPDDAQIRYYSITNDYPIESSFIQPLYLILRKNGNSFAITKSDTDVGSCAVITAQKYALKDAKVLITVTGGLTTEQAIVRKAFNDVIPIGTDDEKTANIRVAIDLKPKNPADLVVFDATNKDGAAIICYFKGQLPAVTTTPYVMNDPSIVGDDMTIKMSISTKKNNLDPKQLGIALGSAFATYYR